MKRKTNNVKDEIITNGDGCRLNITLYSQILSVQGKSESEIKDCIEKVKKENK